jgi:thiamine biosynthesis lipoprotein
MTGSGRSDLLTPRARLLLPVFLVALIFFATRQLWLDVPERVQLDGGTMGTTWSVILPGEGRSRSEIDDAQRAIQRHLDRVDALMSTWDAESELSGLNAHRSGAPFPISPATFEVLRLAQEVSERSGGAFDVTVRPLVAAWGFGAGARPPGQEPDAEVLAALRARVGYGLLELDLATGQVSKRRPDVEVDLSAIAKGFGVDEVARALERLGFQSFFVEVGGEVRCRGERPEGGAWRVGIERPDSEGRVIHAWLELQDRAMATSGDYRSYYEKQGRRLSHILDPRTGAPVQHDGASVSVVHAQAAVADAWATALSVLGPEKGLAVSEREGLAAYFLVRDGRGGFEARATTTFPEVRGRDPRDPDSGSAADPDRESG